MSVDEQQDQTRVWKAGSLKGMDVLRARFTHESFSPHVHSGFGICLVERGGHGFRCKGENWVGDPGSIVLINADQVHTGHNASDQPWAYHAMYPEIDLIEWALPHHQGLPWFTEPVVNNEQSRALLAQLFQALTDDSVTLATETLFINTLNHLVKAHGGQPFDAQLGREQKPIDRIKSVIQDRLFEDISIDELAAEVGWSPTYLVRAFKRETGLPPHAFLVQKRVDAARHLLIRGVPVAEAAVATGFNDQSHLHRHFKKALGITPGAYRAAALG